jgi:hypothetical protein
VVDNAARGIPFDTLVAELGARGVGKRDARRFTLEALGSPAFSAALAERIRELELVVRLRREHRKLAFASGIARRPSVSAEELFDRYFAESRPVVLTDVMRGWKRWTPDVLRSRMGSVKIRYTDEREGDPDYDMFADRHTRTTTMSAFVDRVLAAGATNDFYVVARNRNTEKKAWARLVEDIVIDETIFDPRRVRTGSSFWFGPAGTVTPLHHDTTNILFHQVYGRKRFLLAPPEELELLVDAKGVYAAGDPEADDVDVRFLEVVLEPGEALFLPAGWWHHVRALDVSISFSLTCFRRANDYDWYRPARPPHPFAGAR